MFDLPDKIALVTGASGGIGAEIAKALHAQGATVVLHGTRAKKLESLRAELGDRAFVVTANLADRDAVAGLIDTASAAAGGPIAILVNNAGITRDAMLHKMSKDMWDNSSLEDRGGVRLPVFRAAGMRTKVTTLRILRYPYGP